MKVLIAGDSHCDLKFALWLVQQAERFDCDRIFQVGDFGFWDDTGGRDFLKHLEVALARAGIVLYWLRGNHENHDLLDAAVTNNPRDAEGFVQISEHIRFAPDGHRWEWEATKLLACGGAWSIDKDWRVDNYKVALNNVRREGLPDSAADRFKTWFPQEGISDETVDQCIAGGPCDVLLCHDAPADVDLNLEFHKAGRQFYKDDPESTNNRLKLGQIMYAVKPVAVIHGHHHLNYSQRIHGINVRGLSCNLEPRAAMAVLELPYGIAKV